MRGLIGGAIVYAALRFLGVLPEIPTWRQMVGAGLLAIAFGIASMK
jgi:hypothetical protein